MDKLSVHRQRKELSAILNEQPAYTATYLNHQELLCLASDYFSLRFYNHTRRMGAIHYNIIGNALSSVGRKLYHVTI